MAETSNAKLCNRCGVEKPIELFGKAKMYRDGNRPELAESEEAEIAIITGFLPAQLGAVEVDAAIAAAIESSGAASIKDMGQVMAHLKANHAGQMDFSAASQAVKSALMAKE